MTKVTDGQQMELPNLKMERLECLDLRDFLRRMGVSRMRLIFKSELV